MVSVPPSSLALMDTTGGNDAPQHENGPAEERAQRRLALMRAWAQGAIGEAAPARSRLTATDWDDLRARLTEPGEAAVVVAARISDPDTAARADYREVEEQALDVLLASSPGDLTRVHRTLLVTAAMRFAPVDGGPIPPSTDPLDVQRDALAKHVLDWVVAYNVL